MDKFVTMLNKREEALATKTHKQTEFAEAVDGSHANVSPFFNNRADEERRVNH
jgi:hypothetical protein